MSDSALVRSVRSLTQTPVQSKFVRPHLCALVLKLLANSLHSASRPFSRSSGQAYEMPAQAASTWKWTVG